MKKNYKIIIILLSLIALFLIYLIYYSFKIDNSKQIINNLNNLIIIGDSRMELIANKKDYDKPLPNNIEFIAESGKEISWFNNMAVKQLAQKLKDKSKSYIVVINMGINDLQKNTSVFSLAGQYINSFNALIRLYPNVKFYIMSANPIEEKLIEKYYKENNRTNEKVEKFNNFIVDFINNSNLSNIKYCDTYNNVDFKTKDGLHYTSKTNEKIIDYLVNDCIK